MEGGGRWEVKEGEGELVSRIARNLYDPPK